MLAVFTVGAHAASSSFTAVNLKRCELIHIAWVGMNSKERAEFKERFGDQSAPVTVYLYRNNETREAIGRCTFSSSPSGLDSFSCVGDSDFPLAGLNYEDDITKRHAYRCEPQCASGPTSIYVQDHYGHVNPAFFAELKEADRQCPSFKFAPEFMRAQMLYMQTPPPCPYKPAPNNILIGQTKGGDVNIRDKPSINGKIIRTVPAGTKVKARDSTKCTDLQTIQGELTGQWVEVEILGSNPVTEGWIFDAYITYQ